MTCTDYKNGNHHPVHCMFFFVLSNTLRTTLDAPMAKQTLKDSHVDVKLRMNKLDPTVLPCIFVSQVSRIIFHCEGAFLIVPMSLSLLLLFLLLLLLLLLLILFLLLLLLFLLLLLSLLLLLLLLFFFVVAATVVTAAATVLLVVPPTVITIDSIVFFFFVALEGALV